MEFLDSRQRCVSFGQGVIQFQSYGSGFPCSWQALFWRQQAVFCQLNVTISQPGISQGVDGVYFDSLVKVLDRFLESFFAPSVPGIPAFEVSLVSCRDKRARIRKARSLLRRQLNIDFTSYG